MKNKNFKRLLKTGSGQLQEKAKREEYERLMRQKKTKPPKPDDYDARSPHNTCCGDL